MTEAEWLAATDARAMLQHLWPGRAGHGRKLRLFACAVCRQFGGPQDERAWKAVEAAERFADGLALKREMRAARAVVKRRSLCCVVGHRVAWDAATLAIARSTPGDAAALLVEVFGNPFRPLPALLPVLKWDGGIVPRLALAAYDSRLLPSGQMDPVHLSVLADALTDAGCADEDLLSHLRLPGPHPRGCWVVDLLMGKA